ncbi:HXXXD-type acyl-transferase family protein [Forsythia ovata]|uniref:HXXXD-type acyl-transferase family protein n=1 Tax=Forsythia ovata TaxID=205694 RepID=A0ABD1WBY3_9LAMI
MVLEIELISTDIIKPSSPTPDSLRKYQLSFLDQIAPPIFMPLIYFYPADSKISHLERSRKLKKSLSDALTRFYPLAGRVTDNFYLDCNDEGVPFFEAKAKCNLSQVISNPIPRELDKFIPYELDDIKDLGMAVQVSFFECGGMAIALAISHKIADALTAFFSFANGWAAIARGDCAVVYPEFGAATIFPPRDMAGFKPSTGIVKEDIVTKIFVFPNSKIDALRDKYAYTNNDGGHRMRPTRVEAVSTFIWTRFVASTDQVNKNDPNKIYTIVHAVNLRPLFDPPLSENYFGNISRLAITFPSMEDEWERKGYGIVKQVREAIKSINSAYLQELRQGEKHLNFMKERAAKSTRGEIITLNFTSLCRFPLYEADFGWGKPVWIGSTSFTFKNLVTFIDTPSGDGIEAYINLKKHDMERFEVDKELQEFLSPNPDAKTSSTQH